MTQPVGGEQAASYFEAHKKIYPRETGGRFQRLRKIAVWVLLGLFYLLPWLSVGDRQAVLFDLPARKFYVFGIVFWPQDFFFLTMLLIIAALSLFFFTAILGRIWCGWACPQTVWTEVFIWIERWTEGDRNRRMKLDKGPWTGNKILRKGGKHALWILFSIWTGYTFVGFFSPIRELGAHVLAFSTGPWEAFWILFYGGATLGNAGFLREQVCKYMCPYARFQSAMFDRDSLIIAYDVARGEPRGARRREADPRVLGLGDCIDCKACVQVCPTGIDIRKGLQYECIACAACVDACDDVMDKVGYPRGLVRYTSDNALRGKGVHILRPRTLVYGTLLGALMVAFVVAISLRSPLALDVMRDRSMLYRQLPDGGVENVYLMRILNKDERDHTYVLSVAGVPGISIATDREQHVVRSGEVYTVAARVRVPAGAVRGGREIHIAVESVDDSGLRSESKARFIAP
ncbi:MAG: cytochrome c oxidase accessory protein CcoG [Steroidobacteraceae bacterium]|nr:cytochrome c oxidase accessory protein CcoG [Steroidobacteraceae bacterium]MCC7199184.1 cytochrome c oxidase accessory protein CcoG [Gammaproteobacteria bacterium]